jgi:hypothetical protein
MSGPSHEKEDERVESHLIAPFVVVVISIIVFHRCS